jgi:hypothetical protein
MCFTEHQAITTLMMKTVISEHTRVGELANQWHSQAKSIVRCNLKLSPQKTVSKISIVNYFDLKLNQTKVMYYVVILKKSRLIPITMSEFI